MIQPQNITDYFINNYIKKGDTVIDATAGCGNDTLKLCKSVGKGGKVYAFDIQQIALDKTKEKLEENGFSDFELIKNCHSKMDEYVKKASAIIFNLGYLPGGEHTVHTNADTTIEAIKKSIDIVSDDGFISITLYYGKTLATDEKETVLEFLKSINHPKYTVMTYNFHNRPNNPPLTAIITKNTV